MIFWRNGPADTSIAGNANGAVWEVSPVASPETDRAQSLSAGRAALAAAITVLDDARASLEAASRPVQRLQGIVAELARAEHDLASLDIEYERIVGEWLASGSIGEKPLPPIHRVGLAQRQDALKGDAVAAEAALPPAKERERRAAEQCRDASRCLDEAIAAAAGDAAVELFPRLKDRLAEFFAVEGLLRGLEIALRTAGNKNESNSYFATANPHGSPHFY